MPASPVGFVPQYDISGSLIMREVLTEDVNATGSGNAELVAAVAGSIVRVIRLMITTRDSSKVNVKFQSAANDITGAGPHMLAVDGGGWESSLSNGAWLFQTTVSEALNINLSGTSDVVVDITYYLG